MTPKAKTITILGIDPGLAHMGYAIISISRGKLEIPLSSVNYYILGCIETEKSSKKLNVKSSDDNFRRARDMASNLRILMIGNKISAIGMESMSFPPNSSAANKMGISIGIVAALATIHNIPIIQSSPQDIKKYVCGDKSAKKVEIQTVLTEKYCIDPSKIDCPNSSREHAFDALAAADCAIDSDFIRLALNVR